MNMSGKAMLNTIAEGLLKIACRLAFMSARMARALLYVAIYGFARAKIR